MIDYVAAVQTTPLLCKLGIVIECGENQIVARFRGAAIGDICWVERKGDLPKLKTEVAKVKQDRVILEAFEAIKGVRVGDLVKPTNKPLATTVFKRFTPGYYNGFGDLISAFSDDDLGTRELLPLDSNALSVKDRSVEITPVKTGEPLIDLFTPTCLGQRMGVFAGSGVGKTSLLKSIINGSEFDASIIVLIGERGREVAEFVASSKQSQSNTIVIAATSDRPAIERYYACMSALAMAEYYRDQGLNIGLFIDSLTRLAHALRELALHAGANLLSNGYASNVFSNIPKLIERAGNKQGSGSITAFFTVLVDQDNFNDPIVDLVRSCTDGHVVLSRQLAERSLFPPIDVLKSLSRLVNEIHGSESLRVTSELKRNISIYLENKAAIELSLYEKGSDEDIDRAFSMVRKFESIFYANNKDLNLSNLKELCF